MCLPLLWASHLPECVAISHEHSRHRQLYCDCPVERLTFPAVRADSPASDRGPSHHLPPKSGLQQLRPTFRSVLRSSTLQYISIKAPILPLPCFIASSSCLLATASLPEKVVQQASN